MRVFQKILCPVDFSDYSVLALRYANALARENDAPLIVSHSVPDLSQTIGYLKEDYVETVHEVLMSNAKEKLDAFVRDKKPSRVVMTVEKGNPAGAILKTARKTNCDLIVMGTHGLSGREKFFTGSVTNKVLYKSTIPVLTVCRPTHHFIHEEDHEHPVEIQKILCALDYDVHSRHAAKLAFQIAKMYNADITFFHSVPTVHTKEWQAQENWVKTKLMEFVDRSEEENWDKTKFVVGTGQPAEGILKIVCADQIDLVVLGHHSRTISEELLLGSVAKKVVTDSVCPVLVARSKVDNVAKEILSGGFYV